MNDCGDTYKVYKLASPSGKIYIGITKQPISKRFMNGRGYKSCPAMNNAIQKYGWENIKHEILFDGLSKEQAEQKEIELIAFYKSNQKEYGYNIENGGNAPGTHSEETKRKISAGNKGRIVSKESIEKFKETMRKKGGRFGDKNTFYGKHHSEKVKREHSEFMKGNSYNKGHHHSEEYKRMKSKQMHEKYKDGNNPRCKKIYQISDNKVIEYPSLRTAAKAIGKSPSWLCKRVNDNNNKEWSYEKGA